MSTAPRSRLTVRIHRLKGVLDEHEKMKVLYDLIVPGYTDIHEREREKLVRRIDTLEGVRKKVRRDRYKPLVKEKRTG
jgi:hypothetical protein